MITEQVLNDEKVLNQSEKINVSLTDISKAIKQKLKKEYPHCRFSVRTEFYSMGSSLHVSILETNFKILKPFEDLSEIAVLSYTRDDFRTAEDLKNLQERRHHQITRINKDEVYNPDVWNNGVFLTEEGFNLVKRITELTNKFNWDNSDSQTDYFDVKFYVHLNIGKYDKPLIENI
jgi:hypothetical protein